MHVRPRFAAAFVAAALLSLASTAATLAVSRSSGLTIRITRPSAAILNVVTDVPSAPVISGSVTPSGSVGATGIALVTTDSLATLPSPHIGPIDFVSFSLALELPAGISVVATAN